MKKNNGKNSEQKKQKNILILGAAPIFVDCIRAAKEMGHKVFVIDRNPEAPGMKHADVSAPIDFSDINGTLEFAKKNNIDGIIALNDGGVYTASVVSEKLGLPALPLEVAKIVSSKFEMRDTWTKKGLSNIKYFRVHSVKELKDAAKKIGKYPMIIKPCDSRGGGSKGVRMIRSESELEESFEISNSYHKDNDLMIEECAEGLEHSVEALVYDGEVYIIAISDKVKSPPPYRVDDTIIYPTCETGDRLKQVYDSVKKCILALGITNGVAHIELSITDKGAVPFELGARCGGFAPNPLVPFLAGIDEFKEFIRITMREKPEHVVPRLHRGATIKFFYPPPGKIVSIKGVDEVKKLGRNNILKLEFFLKEGDIVKPLRSTSDRIGYVITGMDTREEALELARKIDKIIRIETVPI